MICGSVPDVEGSLPDNCNDRRLKHLQFSTRSDAKWKLNLRPTKYNLAKFTPLRFCWDFDDYSAWLVTIGIRKSDVKVAVLFRSQVNHPPGKSIPLLFRPEAF
jgi:hypothetical protein